MPKKPPHKHYEVYTKEGDQPVVVGRVPSLRACVVEANRLARRNPGIPHFIRSWKSMGFREYQEETALYTSDGMRVTGIGSGRAG